MTIYKIHIGIILIQIIVLVDIIIQGDFFQKLIETRKFHEMLDSPVFSFMP